MNCYGITNLLLQKFTFTENQTFLRNFYITKIWSHMVLNGRIQCYIASKQTNVIKWQHYNNTKWLNTKRIRHA